VQRNLATIALSIARFEPLSMLVRQKDHALARRPVGADVELIVSPMDDLWMRDMDPVFVTRPSGEKAGVDFNFNGWGDKQEHRNDAKVSAFVSSKAGVPRHATSLVLEGGGIEMDGHGTAIIFVAGVVLPLLDILLSAFI
jgi:agmatine deiminase